jgi:hypothetical protein
MINKCDVCGAQGRPPFELFRVWISVQTPDNADPAAHDVTLPNTEDFCLDCLREAFPKAARPGSISKRISTAKLAQRRPDETEKLRGIVMAQRTALLEIDARLRETLDRAEAREVMRQAAEACTNADD